MTNFTTVMPFERELRRWTRLRPEILTRCRIRLVDGRKRIRCELLDLSPGGIGLAVVDKNWKPRGPIALVEVRFKGQPTVVRAAEIRRITETTTGALLGMAWMASPEAWNGVERRSRDRIVLPQDSLFARTPLRHAHNVWTRLTIVDVGSDYGFQVETRGGPAYLLPGHFARLHLDLPQLHRHGWDCQILWVKPSEGQIIRMGLRVLEPDPALEEILSEWLQIRRDWSPMELQNLGFGKDSLPGQYRFRKIEEIAESVSVANFLEEMSRRRRRTGMEPLHAIDRISDHDTIHLGCWDGRKLVAAVTLDSRFDELVSDSSHSKIADFAIEPDWIVPEVFVGLWEQTIRLFLASGNETLWVWCPPGRDELFRLAGFATAEGPRLPGGIGTWMNISRTRLISGRGMNPTRWAILYSNVSSFVMQHQKSWLSVPGKLTRWRNLAIFGLLRDWREPRERRKLRDVIECWSADVFEIPVRN